METVAILLHPLYLDRILTHAGAGIIKVLTGQRRVGKSFILSSVDIVARGS